MTLVLEGNIDNRDELIRQLRDEIEQLEQDLTVARAETARAKGEASRAVSALRRQLHPLYQALQLVFGAIEAIPEEAQPITKGTVTNDSKARVWESWKQKLGGKAAEAIDALLDHGEMSVPQLRVAMKCHIQTVYDTMSKLYRLGLLNKNGGKYSLKQL